MTASGVPAAPENPFSTRHVRPGAIPYRFPPGRSAAALIERLEENGWRGQIIGPHGSGKSALVATLIESLEQSGRRTVSIVLHDGQRRLPAGLLRRAGLAGGALWFVDGYEQLALVSRFLLRRFCRRHGLGLVVTAHRSVGFPDLCRTTTSLLLARQIVQQLLGESRSLLGREEIHDRFARQRGNLREVLFDLYDLYEQRRPREGDSTDGSAV